MTLTKDLQTLLHSVSTSVSATAISNRAGRNINYIYDYGSTNNRHPSYGDDTSILIYSISGTDNPGISGLSYSDYQSYNGYQISDFIPVYSYSPPPPEDV